MIILVTAFGSHVTFNVILVVLLREEGRAARSRTEPRELASRALRRASADVLPRFFQVQDPVTEREFICLSVGDGLTQSCGHQSASPKLETVGEFPVSTAWACS